MSVTTALPQALMDLYMDCPECNWHETPDMVQGHLIEQHDYTVDQAQRSVNGWADGFSTDEHGNPLLECSDHGLYSADSIGCPGCRFKRI